MKLSDCVIIGRRWVQQSQRDQRVANVIPSLISLFNSLRPSDAYLTIIVSDNGLSPYRRQAIIWTNAGILLIGPLGTNVGEILIEILTLSFKKMRLKVSSSKRRPFCLGLNVLMGAINSVCCIIQFMWRQILLAIIQSTCVYGGYSKMKMPSDQEERHAYDLN